MTALQLPAVLGESLLCQALQRLIARQRLPHTVVIEGGTEALRTAVAQALAAAVLCPHKPDGAACAACPSCRHCAQGTHPDLVALPGIRESPTGLPVDAVRAAAEQAGSSALLGVGRVFIIPDAERLRGAAANALLKILEEPPPRTVFILAAQAAANLLPTIRSRAAVYRLPDAAPPTGAQIDNDRPAPAALARLLTEPSLAAIAEVLTALEKAVPNSAGQAGQRQVLALWLQQQIACARHELRSADPSLSGRALQHCERLLRALHDLELYLPPRSVLEALCWARSSSD